MSGKGGDGEKNEHAVDEGIVRCCAEERLVHEMSGWEVGSEELVAAGLFRGGVSFVVVR